MKKRIRGHVQIAKQRTDAILKMLCENCNYNPAYVALVRIGSIINLCPKCAVKIGEDLQCICGARWSGPKGKK